MENKLVDKIIQDIKALNDYQITFVEQKKEGNQFSGRQLVKKVITKTQVLDLLKRYKVNYLGVPDIINELDGIKNDLEFPLGSENVEDYEDAVDDAVLRLDDLQEKIKGQKE